MLFIGALSAAVGLCARFFTVIDVHHSAGYDARTENKGALSVIRNAPTDVITTYVLLETSAYSRDDRLALHLPARVYSSFSMWTQFRGYYPTNDAINSSKNGCSLKLRGDGDLHLQSRARARPCAQNKYASSGNKRPWSIDDEMLVIPLPCAR